MKLKEAYTSLAMTGRVKSWLQDSTRRYPVSCTVMVIDDNYKSGGGV